MDKGNSELQFNGMLVVAAGRGPPPTGNKTSRSAEPKVAGKRSKHFPSGSLEVIVVLVPFPTIDF